jgi:hypothetical protein
MDKKMKYLFFLFILFSLSIGFISCRNEEENKSADAQPVEYSPQKDMDIQRYKLDVMIKNAKSRTPGDKSLLLNTC